MVTIMETVIKQILYLTVRLYNVLWRNVFFFLIEVVIIYKLFPVERAATQYLK